MTNDINLRFDTYLSQGTSQSVKGILALIVVLSHLRNNISWLNDTVLGMLFTASGYLAVAMFLFYSGYGITFQYMKRGKAYIKAFPKKRIFDLYVKYVIVLFIYIVFYLLRNSKILWQSILKSLLFGGTIVANGWYIQVILLSYLMFYFITKYLPQKYLPLGFLLEFVIYLLIYKALNLSGLYIQSYLAYIFGAFYAFYQKRIEKFFKNIKRFCICLFVTFILFSLTLLCGNLLSINVTIKLIIKCFSSVFFVFLVLLILLIINFRNRVSEFLGKISFEIYMIHGIFLSVFIGLSNKMYGLIYCFAVCGLSIICALILNWIFTKLSKIIKGN